MRARVLVVDDYAAVAALIGASLRSAGYEAEEAVAYADGVRAIESKSWDAIVSDLSLDGGHTGLEVLEAANRSGGVPFILMSGLADVDSASRAVQAGAVDCLAKPVDMSRLASAVARAVERGRAPAAMAAPAAERLVGATQSMVDVYQSLARAAHLDVPVLITGPEGCGKLLAAREIHRLSACASADCRVIECAGTSMAQLESEMAAARTGGTVILRRVGEMAREVQARLAELIDEGGVSRYVATTRGSVGDLAAELLYALGPGAIRMPALRDRADDIALIAGGLGLRLSPEATSVLRAYDWPGNVRELRDVLAEAARASRGGALAGAQVEDAIRSRARERALPPAATPVSFCASCGRTVGDGDPAAGGECEHAVIEATPRFAGKRYVPYRQLARGASTEVWVAWQPSLSRRVVIKIMRATDSDEAARFRRESRIHASLRHPRVPAVIEAGADPANPNRLFMVMEHVEGQPLHVHVRALQETRGAEAALRAAVRSCSEAAAVLGYLHERGLVHRDVKPQNILVDAEGVRLIDYGLARPVGDADELTTVGVVQGTIPYMSPEHTRARPADMDARSDVWSLGATLYTLATGRHPFGAGEYEEVAERIREADPEPMRTLNPRVSVELEAVVARAMAKDPRERYADGRELHDALAALAAEEVVTW
jgi:DNA-binding NtrC family response regulator/tRNA A-37 threonylcarbamoyl transferase component Bud32